MSRVADIDSSPVSLAAHRYANALFAAANAAGLAQAVAKNMSLLADLLRDSADFRRFIASPFYNRETQERFVKAFLKQAGADLNQPAAGEKSDVQAAGSAKTDTQAAEGAKADELVGRFLCVLARHKRLFALPQILAVFAAKAAKARGEMTVSVVSAEELSAAQRKDLQTLLADMAAKDKKYSKYLQAEKLIFQVRVDPALLGGFIVRCGSLLIDASLRSKLHSLKLALKEVA